MEQNRVAEFTFKTYSKQNDTLDFNVHFTAPNGSKKTVPCFFAGKNEFKARYSSSVIGKHTFITECEAEKSVNGLQGEFEISPYTGKNELYLHGGLDKKTNTKYLVQKDGTPFFWLADTWWMGLTTRISDDEFLELIKDRIEKGFNTVQIVAGLYPDMVWYDERGKNSAGYPWSEDFSELNPQYFDTMEKRIIMLCDNGITPCIVGSWGFFIKTAGKTVLLRHWRNLIARFAAYPVAWCIAGEATMQFYDSKTDQEEYAKFAKRDWTDITKYVTDADPFKRLITIHPSAYGHNQVNDISLLDLDMLQTGHNGAMSLVPTMSMIKKTVELNQMPVINSEVCYEGICGSSFEDVQRYAFLSCIFLGACGHTYGANGIWQLNGIDIPYGPSPHGAQWGLTSWKDAAQLLGSKHVGQCKKYITKFDWWKFEPHPEWVERSCSSENIDGHFAAGIPGELVLIFKPNFGGDFWGEVNVSLEPCSDYKFERFNAVTGEITDCVIITADPEGKYKTPRVNFFGDWIYSFEKLR